MPSRSTLALVALVLLILAVAAGPVSAFWTSAEYTSLLAMTTVSDRLGDTGLNIHDMIRQGLSTWTSDTMTQFKLAHQSMHWATHYWAMAASYFLNVDPATDAFCADRATCVAAGVSALKTHATDSVKAHLTTAQTAFTNCATNTAGKCGFGQTATFRTEASTSASLMGNAISAINSTFNASLTYTNWNFDPWCPSTADCRVFTDRHGNYLEAINNSRKSQIAAAAGGIGFTNAFDWMTNGESVWTCCTASAGSEDAGYGWSRLAFRLEGSNTPKLRHVMFGYGVITSTPTTTTPGLLVPRALEHLVAGHSASQDRDHSTEGLAYHMRQLNSDSFTPIARALRTRATSRALFYVAWHSAISAMWYRSDIGVWDATKIDQTTTELQTKRANKLQANDPRGCPVSCYYTP